MYTFRPICETSLFAEDFAEIVLEISNAEPLSAGVTLPTLRPASVVKRNLIKNAEFSTRCGMIEFK